MTAEIGDNTNEAEAQQVLAKNSAEAMQAARDANGIDEQLRNLESSDVANIDGAPSGAPNPEADVALEVVTETLGVTAVKVAKTMLDTVQDMDPGKFGGMATMENMGAATKPSAAPAKVARDIAGDKVRSINSPHVQDIFASVTNAGDSVNGESPITGAKADKAAALITERCKLNTLQRNAELTAGLAAKKGADLGAQAHRTNQMGLSPDGSVSYRRAQSEHMELANNSRAPKPPSQDIVEETGAA